MYKKQDCWRNMLKRCLFNDGRPKNESYVGCNICDEWLIYNNFEKWYDIHYVEGWELDKDILIKGNKIYSPETCCFVPREINILFTNSRKTRGSFPIGVSFRKDSKKYRTRVTMYGKYITIGQYNTEIEAFNAYKETKEKHIKEVADKYKNLIPQKVYNSLYNYKVEITD